MDGRGALKTEDGIGPVTSFTDTIPASWALSDVAFDFYGEAERGPYSLPSSSSMGFMELLGVQGLGPSSLLDSAEAPDVHGAAAAVPTASVPPSPTASTPPESSSEVVNNLPTTPNSSSVSSAWNEALNKELKDHALEHEEDHEKTQKQLKARKGNKKRQQREARVAFMTKSEVDHLEDGYRWRKYGQKAVKNSPFPRSYYRCTNAICNVKKRVERSFSDPSIVVTTYEGHHTHPSPNNILRDTCSHAAILSNSTAAALFATPTTTAALLPHHYYNINLQHPRRPQPHFNALLSPLNAAAYKTSPAAATTPASVFLGDHGLLQDVVPSTTMGKERKNDY